VKLLNTRRPGGGACWDHSTCSRPDNSEYLDTSVLTDVVDPFFGLQIVDCAQWNSVFHGPVFGGLVDPEEPGNPVSDWTYVFVPYCTKVSSHTCTIVPTRLKTKQTRDTNHLQDVHIGNVTTTYISSDDPSQAPVTFNHNGRSNVNAVLDFVKATFPNPDKIFVTVSFGPMRRR